MKHLKLAILTSILLTLLLSSFAFSADVLTFEDLYPGYETCCPGVPSGYGGYYWSTYAMLTTKYKYPDTGYEYGTVGQVSLITGAAKDISMSSTGYFDFNGAYITAARADGQDVTVEGERDGSVVFSSTITTSYDQPYWFAFEYTDIDKLWFKPGDEGTPELGAGHHIVIDNITLNSTPVVPEPVSSTLFLIGGGLMGFRRFRKA